MAKNQFKIRTGGRATTMRQSMDLEQVDPKKLTLEDKLISGYYSKPYEQARALMKKESEENSMGATFGESKL